MNQWSSVGQKTFLFRSIFILVKSRHSLIPDIFLCCYFRHFLLIREILIISKHFATWWFHILMPVRILGAVGVVILVLFKDSDQLPIRRALIHIGIWVRVTTDIGVVVWHARQMRLFRPCVRLHQDFRMSVLWNEWFRYLCRWLFPDELATQICNQGHFQHLLLCHRP